METHLTLVTDFSSDELNLMLSSDYLEFLESLVESKDLFGVWFRASQPIQTKWLRRLAEDIHADNPLGENDEEFEKLVDWAKISKEDEA